MALSRLDPFARAARHPIARDTPAVDFFEGALLGNGGLGAVVCTRPDAVMIHLGHNNVWDIRIAEANQEKIGTFQEVFERVKAIPTTHKRLTDDPWFRDYIQMTRENYAKPYPRPFPCGTLVLGFDRRNAEVLGHRIDIATGLCEVRFAVGGNLAFLQIFADTTADRLWLRTVDAGGKPAPSPFNRVRLIPDPETPKEMPAFSVVESAIGNRQSAIGASLSFHQVLPSQEPHAYDAAKGHPKDRAFRLSFRVSDRLESRTRTDTWSGIPHEMDTLERAVVSSGPFNACLQLDEGLASVITQEPALVPLPAPDGFECAAAASREAWRTFWTRSGVALDDELLERTWYWNLYFLNCSARPGNVCPGLFANWSYRNIGTAWHGDYHLDYNVQQPFWVTFSTNHADKDLPYADMVDHLLPVCRKWASEYYRLRGACFPVTGYPVEMNFCPYPLPTWGWQLCVTPWAVQNLWWHYRYTMDKEFLARRAFEPIKQAVLFTVDFMKRPEARGPQWGDDKYHVFPSVPTELYGLRPGFQNNADPLADLTLAKFLSRSYLEACAVLGREGTEEALMDEVRDVLAHFPEYPTAASARGKVFVSVPGENPEIVQNVPNSVMTVFPGEEHGLHSPPDEFQIAANSYRNHRNEGGNDLVFFHLQGARLGLLDLEKFKRQIEYCLLPNGTCTDKCLQAHGRYQDTTAFDFMARMGVWFENFALPVVINECLLQSYDGTLRFFPNWPAGKRAEFRTLRAVGAFLVSARIDAGKVQWIEVRSEAGKRLRLINPWPGDVTVRRRTGEQLLRGDVIELDTLPHETIEFAPAV